MDEPIKITIEELEDEAPSLSEPSPGRVRLQTERIRQAATNKLKDASGRVGRKATDVATGAAASAANRSSDLIQERVVEVMEAQAKATAAAVETRLRETDWQAEAEKGASSGLKWLSARLAEMTNRLEKPDEATKESE